MNCICINNFFERIKSLSRENKRKVLYRRKLFKLLTISEAEMIYTSFISKELFETKTNIQTKKKEKKRISFWKLKLNIKMKVSNEQILYCVPRFKEVEY